LSWPMLLREIVNYGFTRHVNHESEEQFVCFVAWIVFAYILKFFKPGWEIKADSAILHIYSRLGSVFTLTKRILLKILKLYIFSIIYNNIVKRVVKLFRVQPMIIMMNFNMSTSYFHITSFHYFENYLMMKLTLG
jgi:hypothetical protein